MEFITSYILNYQQNEENSEERYTPLSIESLSATTTASKMQVILRIRPTSLIDQRDCELNVYEVQDSHTLLIKHVNFYDAARRSNAVKPSDNLTRRKFKFTNIFNIEADQEVFFREAIEPTVIDFLNNKSSTIISHGTAEAGKTYTSFGTIAEPGIIPRTIEFIYSSLNCTLVPSYKPKDHKTVVDLDDCGRALEMDIRKKLLSCRYVDRMTCQEVYEALGKSIPYDNQGVLKDSMYSVWISFVEIYNDGVFDLLEVDEDGKNMQLKLAIDKHGATFIQGMRTVCATTGLEAYEIFLAGQTRLSTVQSSSGYKSSRSHSIFTIKLLKYEHNSDACDVEMSCLSFCDLAGTGRIQKAISNDKQLKESRSINTSLLAFGRCLKVLAESHSRQSTGPFRDSKLTRLFQHSLQKENIILLINLNPNLELFAETQSVLNFASTAMKLTSEFAKEDKRVADFYTPISSPKVGESRLSIDVNVTQEHDTHDILSKNKQLLASLEELRSHQLQKEFSIREELTNSFTEKLNNLEKNWKERMKVSEEEKKSLIKFSVERVKDFYKNQLEKYKNRERETMQDKDNQESLDMKTLEAENILFNEKISSMETMLQSLTDHNKELMEEKTRYAFELSLLKSELAKMSDFLQSSSDKYDPENFTNSELDNSKILDYGDSMYHFQKVNNFVKKLVEFNKNAAKSEEKYKRSLDKEIQCSILHDFFKEIRESLNFPTVTLPVIDDSFEEQEQIYHRHKYNENLSDMLVEIKSCITKNVAKVKKLECENREKFDELNILKEKNWKNESEIQRMNILYQESESSRLSLTEKLKDLENSLKSREFFKNPDFMTVELENSLSNESNPQLVSTEQISTSRDSFDYSNLSSIESETGRVGNRAMRFSSDSSGNDSGLASTVGYAVHGKTDDKYCQTIISNGNDNFSFQHRLMQLKVDYKRMHAQHGEESQRVTELSQELNHIKETMSKLKENTLMKELAITEYQSKLSSSKLEIERLSLEKKTLEIKCNELTRKLQEASIEYEKKLTEYQVRFKVHEEGENRAAKCLEDYWEKSVNLGSELSIVYSELEKNSIRCYEEHITKIDKLEKELNERKIKENELDTKIINYRNDLSEIHNLSGKVQSFESLLNEIQKERADLHRLFNESCKNQSEVEGILRDLVAKTEERDHLVLSLRSDIDAIIQINLSNNRKAKELDQEIADLLVKISSMKEDLAVSEEARKDLEQSSNKEINSLRARLTIFEENAELLGLIRDTHENKQHEVERFKLKLLEKDKELEFFKKNRNSTIQRYECLVRQLQDALKMNYQSCRSKKVSSHKKKLSGSQPKESTLRDLHCSEQKINEWKSLYENHNRSLSCSSIRTFVHDTKAIPSENNQLVTGFSKKSLQFGYNLRSQNLPRKDSDVSSYVPGNIVEMNSPMRLEKR